MDSLTKPALISSTKLFPFPSLIPNKIPKALNFLSNNNNKTDSASRFALHCNPTARRNGNTSNAISSSLNSAAAAAVLFSAILPFNLRPAFAAVVPTTSTSMIVEKEEKVNDFAVASDEKVDDSVVEEEVVESKGNDPSVAALSHFIDSDPEALSSVRSLLYQKLEDGEDKEASEILRRLVAAQPAESEWKFLLARLLSENREYLEARRILEEILAVDPLSFEALFENAVIMDKCGKGPAVIERLERALDLAQREQNDKAARDVRLIMAQIQFLQRNVDGALNSYEELAKEDPKDYRPYFCQGVIYSLIDKNGEAREKFAKYRELSPRNFDVDAYLQTPLSRVKLSRIGDSQI